jgi:hypothetical protein
LSQELTGFDLSLLWSSREVISKPRKAEKALLGLEEIKGPKSGFPPWCPLVTLAPRAWTVMSCPSLLPREKSWSQSP